MHPTNTSTLSLRPSLTNGLSNGSIASLGTTRHGHYNFSTQLISKSWVKLQVESIYHDLKNDEYEIRLSDSMIISFDYNTKQCSFRVPSNKIQVDSLKLSQSQTQLSEKENNYDEIDEFLKEIDNQTAVLQLIHKITLTTITSLHSTSI